MVARPTIGADNLSVTGTAQTSIRVLQVVQAYFPFEEHGGPVVKVRALARGLARRGHEVTVLTADLGLGGREARIHAQRCPWGWRIEEDGVEAIYLSSVAHYRALTINPAALAFCRSALAEYDLAHFYGLYDLLGPAVSHFCRQRGVPYVIEPMGMYRPIDRSFRLKRLWHRSLGRRFWGHAAQIVATSEMEQQELLADGVAGEKIVVRYNGVDAETNASLPARGTFRARWGISSDEPLVLFLGRLIPRKGADILIDAFSQALPESGQLAIGGPEGEPGYRRQLEKRARDRGVAGRVRFTGALYGEEKKAALADADVFALPSRYENFANAAAEALACAVPVIVTESCGISTLVNGRAGLVVAREEQALAGALKQLLSDEALYNRLKRGCQEVVQELSWGRLTERMEAYYTAAMERGNGSR